MNPSLGQPELAKIHMAECKLGFQTGRQRSEVFLLVVLAYHVGHGLMTQTGIVSVDVCPLPAWHLPTQQ